MLIMFLPLILIPSSSSTSLKMNSVCMKECILKRYIECIYTLNIKMYYRLAFIIFVELSHRKMMNLLFEKFNALNFSFLLRWKFISITHALIPLQLPEGWLAQLVRASWMSGVRAPYWPAITFTAQCSKIHADRWSFYFNI